MLSVKSRVSGRRVDAAARTRVLERLQEQGFTPLIRTMRLGAFEEALAAGGEPPKDMERLMAAWADAESDAPYVRGDLFCFESHIFFLIFGGDAAAHDDEGCAQGSFTAPRRTRPNASSNPSAATSMSRGRVGARRRGGRGAAADDKRAAVRGRRGMARAGGACP